MTPNRDLDSACPKLAAVKTRILHLGVIPSDPGIRALMRQLTRRGWDADGRHMEPYECQDAIEYRLG